ncbi:UDP-D-xylose:L-fucose alpha-1,3-D-xylosyltransferase MGP4-like isoform X2 [Rhododendron vialii]|uniref:UDP-D-xylose:L-fucose alpha-1,3-D-xylosyltransferase MGP4-like isoform X2 n=1 Tax=Rhododendron vialii TaxID=182163 RepID=UPI00265D8C8D|nr:UDP-D-xylose:L-fucose alpha-1,3-D-xylosyltransferase MGP4-like isoform X2 [Rhododendron vialii]
MSSPSTTFSQTPTLHPPLILRPTPPKSPAVFTKTTLLLLLLSPLVVLGVCAPWLGTPQSLFTASPSSSQSSLSKWRDYTLPEAAARSGTIIVCAVSQPYLPFLNNWLISIARQKRHEQVLVIAEDYATLYEVNGKWPGHAVLVLPSPDAQTAHKFGSQGFFNFTSRRPRHLLQILELGYNVMYNDIDIVWLADPFSYLQGKHDVYFTDDMAAVDLYLFPQAAFPTGGLYFKNQTWVQ